MADSSERLFEAESSAGQGDGTSPAAPLATRMRPRDLEEFAGQGRLLAAGSALRIAVE